MSFAIDDPRHGTYAGGRVHRLHGQPVCEPCRRAEARYENERQLDLLAGRPRALPAEGTRRRIQALAALGYTFARQAVALGVTQSAVSALAIKPRAYIRATTAAKITSLYDAWSMQLPPLTTSIDRKNASYARTVAARNNWAPPLAWDDDTIDDPHARPLGHDARQSVPYDHAVVERILAGDRPAGHRLCPSESAEIVRRARARGMGEAEICERFGIKAERHARSEVAS